MTGTQVYLTPEKGRTPLRARVLGLDPSGPGVRRRRVALVAGGSLAVAVAVAWGLWRLADADLLGVIFSALTARPALVAVFVVTYLGAFALRAEAWRWMLRGSLRFGSLLEIIHLSLLANHVLPAKPGDLLRGYLAYRMGVPGGRAAVTTVAARLLDVAALVLIVAVLGPLALAGSGVSGAAVAVVAAAALAVGLALAGIPSLPGRLLDRFPPLVRRAVDQVSSGVKDLPPGRTAASFVVLVLPSWFLEAGVLWSVVEAAGLEISPIAAVAVTAVTIVPQAVQVTPGNVGIYEATMTAALVGLGFELIPALTVATATHALKFAYSYAAGAVILAGRGARVALGRVRRGGKASASRIEVVAARVWNVLNEGKPFTLVFSALLLVGAQAFGGLGGVSWGQLLVAVASVTPLALVFLKYAFPLRLRLVLWAFVALYLLWFREVNAPLLAAFLVAYFGFTVVMWGTVYYHWRMGTPLHNFTRFWKLVLENPDTTSANFLEQAPKVFLLSQLAAAAAVPGGPGPGSVLLYTAVVAVVGVLVHAWLFTWRPPVPVRVPPRPPVPAARSRRFILIVIDGCRVDRLAEAHTPVLDRLGAEGTVAERMETVYPARTVTGFSSMLTGAPPRVHGMRSNFVPRLGVRCESVFDVLRESGRCGRLVGIAHLLDAFGGDVRAVTAVQDNERIDPTLVSEAQDELLRHDPDLLVLQLLSVDQTGHARGSYREEYVERIEATDRLIGDFVAWLDGAGLLEGTTIGITSDHGQGRGVGGHGHMGPGEREVPFLLWGEGVPAGGRIEGTRSLMDVAPTVCSFLGLRAPASSAGNDLTHPEPAGRPIAVVIPAHDEAENLPRVMSRIPDLGDVRVIVVDDGSLDGLADVARDMGARVVRHETRLGLGAALRTGFDAAMEVDPRAVVYLDADGEYDAAEIPKMLAPIETGEADYVIGSRFRGSIDGMAPSRRIGNAVFTTLVTAATGRRTTDGQTGMRALSRRALAVAEIVHDYNYAQVLTMDLLSKGMVMAEVPITYRQRTNGRSFISPRYLWKVPAAMVRQLVRG